MHSVQKTWKTQRSTEESGKSATAYPLEGHCWHRQACVLTVFSVHISARVLYEQTLTLTVGFFKSAIRGHVFPGQQMPSTVVTQHGLSALGLATP